MSADAPGLGLVALAAILGYLLGSIPFGLILTRLAGHGDIRALGSGNIGATNVLRTGNKPLAAATLLLDGGKGAAAALLAAHWGGETASLAAALAAVLGHNFPVWLGFRGGKGVATTLGVLLAIAWPAGLAAVALWIAAALIFRISSLAALIALAASPLLMLALADVPRALLAAVLAALAIARHHTNIRRLLAGTEPKIGRKGAGERPVDTA
ncbi:MAG TPA: glycerol-3-phosphate 1-O-acyltransferase PlsY [Rhodospirillales bacterium]|nr:glycerol-3-phosphate 1-O-acyltransferase PlsY [Rhodospirillales bacterium]